MALSNLHTNYNISYKDDLVNLTKAKENGLLKGGDLTNLNAQVDATAKSIALGYGYDVFQNYTTLTSDLSGLASSATSNLSNEQAIQAVKDLIGSHRVNVDGKWQFKQDGDINSLEALQKKINSTITLSTEQNATILMTKELDAMQEKVVAKTGLGESNELIALVDMAFNGGMGLIGPKLTEAIANDDRVTAWYEIKYNSNKPNNDVRSFGLQNRRDEQSDLFCLYSSEDGKTPTTSGEADYVIQFLESRRSNIENYLKQVKNDNGVIKGNIADLNNALSVAEVFLTGGSTGDIYTFFTADKFQLTADYFGMTFEELRNTNPNLFISEDKGYVLIEQYTTLSANNVEMNFLSNENVLVNDGNGDYHLIINETNIDISASEATAILMANALANGDIDVTNSNLQKLYFASKDENSTWMTYLKENNLPIPESANDVYIASLESALNASDVTISEDANGNTTIRGNEDTFVISDEGIIMQYDEQASTVTIMTGADTEASYTIAYQKAVNDEILGSIAETFSSSKDVTLPDGFQGEVILSSTESTEKITLSSMNDNNGEIIGTEITVQNDTYETITQSYNDTTLPTITTITTDNFEANYSNGEFQGFSSINGASVSAGFNDQFIENLDNQGLDTPSVEDLSHLSENLGENATDTDVAIKAVYDSTIENAVSSTDNVGKPTLITQTESTLKTIGSSITVLGDALSLISAIQSGSPLPIVATGLKLTTEINGIKDIPNLGAASNIATGLVSIMSLSNALKSGDSIAAVTAGASALYFSASGFSQLASSSTEIGTALTDTLGSTAGSTVGALGEALPYLSIVNSIAHGDYVGAAVAVVSYFVPVIGWAYAAYSIVSSLFGGGHDDIPDPWGNGRYVWNGTSITYQTAGQTGGNEAVQNVMNSVLTVLNSLIEQQRQINPTSVLGIIPNRMPTIAYDMSGYRYTDIDPLTGEEKHAYLRFDTSGNPYNATPGSTESYQSITEAMIRSEDYGFYTSTHIVQTYWDGTYAKIA